RRHGLRPEGRALQRAEHARPLAAPGRLPGQPVVPPPDRRAGASLPGVPGTVHSLIDRGTPRALPADRRAGVGSTAAGSTVTIAHARELLQRAFPYGATVLLENAGPFVSLSYEVTRIDRSRGVVHLRFERDPGDTIPAVAPADLERAALTGRLEVRGGRVRRPEVGDVDLLAWPFDAFVGPQYRGDDAFQARMRAHQSWWRTFRILVPFGTGPSRSSDAPYGNM